MPEDEEHKSRGPLVAPCLCEDDQSLKPSCGRFVHRRCLDVWRSTGLNPSNLTRCEVCRGQYRLEGNPRPAYVHALIWIGIILQLVLLPILAVVVGQQIPDKVLDYLPSRFVAGLLAVCYVVGVMAAFYEVGKMICSKCCHCGSGARQGIVGSSRRYRTWTHNARQRRDHSWDCCSCGTSDRLLLWWALHQQGGGSSSGGSTGDDCPICCPLDDCCMSVAIGTPCECCPCPLDCLFPEDDGDEQAMGIQLIAIITILVVVLAGGAVLVSWFAVTETTYWIRLRAARRNQVIGRPLTAAEAPVDGVVDGQQAAELGKPAQMSLA